VAYRLSWMVSALACWALVPWSRAQDAPAQGKDEPPKAAAPEPAAEEDAPRKFVAPKLAGPTRRPERALGPTLQTYPVRRGTIPYTSKVIDASVLPREKSPELDYDDQTAEFTRNAAVKGQASGASAVVLDQIDYGKNGTLTLGKVLGAFKDGETLADDKGGSATVKGGLREGIWVLDFTFKPVRIVTVEIDKQRVQVYYMWYRVINRTGKPRFFVPEFKLVTAGGKVHPDVPLPLAVPKVQTREGGEYPVLGLPMIQGYIPPSTKPNIDDAVYGVAFWIVDKDLARADAFKIYVRGLSDSLQTVQPPGGGAPQTRYKTLRVDFVRYGDEHDLKESEIHLLDPPYEWTYW